MTDREYAARAEQRRREAFRQVQLTNARASAPPRPGTTTTPTTDPETLIRAMTGEN